MCPHPRCQGTCRASIGAGVQRGDRPMAGPEHTSQRLSNRRGVWMLGNQTGKYPPRGGMVARRFRKRTQGCSWKAPSPEDPTLNCVKVAKAQAQFLWVSAWDAQPPSLMAEACASLKSWDKHSPMESFWDSRLLLLLSMETTFLCTDMVMCPLNHDHFPPGPRARMPFSSPFASNWGQATVLGSTFRPGPKRDA